ncbi:MAG TPA: bifunctional hydroxymethylpyrimidine kinase/phosphomethylpyrimidine kinase [Rickettsiales bacterium]|nr:bifunctional hydroxymethylpyrimidine kinase/phosphomethylpyrimidine kinase [Rickettsiales bacterium]
MAEEASPAGTQQGRVLIVAGSDSGGGAGIQGDIKTVTMLGGYAATAITALTAQNTRGVFGIHPVPAEFVAQQMRLVLEDIGADAIKTGMLLNASIIAALAEVLEEYPDIPLILDPVMVAKGGAPLLEPEAIELLMKYLIPRAYLLTPNIPEAELLLGTRWYEDNNQENTDAAEKLLTLGCRNVLLKGGHAEGADVTDILVASDDAGQTTTSTFTSPRFHTPHTHGTGCTLASAVATGIAQGLELEQAVIRARAYVQEAIRTAPGLGHGHGPLNHRVKDPSANVS